MTSIRLALINDHPLVVQGLRAILADQPDMEVVELDTLVDVAQPVDIALVDTFGQSTVLPELVRQRLQEPAIRRVALFSWKTDKALVQQALAAGASGVVSKTVDPATLATDLRTIASGQQVVDLGEDNDEDVPSTQARPGRDWPGREHGLSMREAEMVTLISQGLTNDEICERLFLSLNSVKSYIRTAYAKIGVQSRSQAVIWAFENGLRPQASREQTAG